MFGIPGEDMFVALIGLGGGLLLGLAARLGRFCTLGAIEDALYGGSDLRLRMWGVAIGVAVIGSFLLMGTDLLNAGETAYLTRFSLPASVIGGLIFGYGMALAGNCGYGALARLGGGDLRAFVIVLVMGVAAYVTLSGPLAYLRVVAFPMEPASQTTGIAHGLSGATGLAAPAIGIAIGLAILAATLAKRAFREERAMIFWGTVVGLAIVGGWAGTQWVAFESMGAVPVVSHTFSAPVGETILYAMTSSGGGLSFGVGSVAGVWVGAFIGSLIKGHFRWEACEDPRELRRQIFGAGLMGVGAVTAMGCSIGQGLSAMSLLAWSAPITLASIGVGTAFGLRQLIVGFRPA